MATSATAQRHRPAMNDLALHRSARGASSLDPSLHRPAHVVELSSLSVTFEPEPNGRSGNDAPTSGPRTPTVFTSHPPKLRRPT